MYNINMKKISVLIILALILCFQVPAESGMLSKYNARIQQNNYNKTTVSEIKALFNEQVKQADKHCLTGLQSMYSKDFVNSDGFNYDTYMKMVEETWETYPDITYSIVIDDIKFTDKYAAVSVTETAVAAPVEKVGALETVGELYSVSKCIYHLEKHGTVWLISSEDIIEETSTLKYGEARYINIELDSPKQVGAGKYYTSSLKISIPPDAVAVASIGNEKIIYPQEKSQDVFRRVSGDLLERVMLSNKENVNEYNIASVGITHIKDYDEEHVKVYMSGLAFVMTRVNVIPENKFVKREKGEK